MPAFKVTGPDGRVFKVTAASIEDADAAVTEMYGAKQPAAEAPKPAAPSKDEAQMVSGAYRAASDLGSRGMLGEAVQRALDVPVGLVQSGINYAAGVVPSLSGAAEDINKRVAERQAGFESARMAESQKKIDQIKSDPSFQRLAKTDPNMAQYVLDRELPGTTLAGIFGTLVGGTVIPGGRASAGFLPTVAKGAAVGAVASQAEPQVGFGGAPVSPEQFRSEGAKRAMFGGAIGGAVPAVGRTLSAGVRGVGGEDIRKLRELGVSPTLGQTLGVGKQESALTSAPWTGYLLDEGYEGVRKEFSEGMANKALGYIGESLSSSGMPIREVVKETKEKIEGAYDSILSKAKPAYADPTLLSNIRTDLADVGALSPDREVAVMRVLTNIKRKTGNKKIDGFLYKEIDKDLREAAVATADDREKRILRDIKESFRDWFDRKNPSLTNGLRSADSAYADLVPLEGSVTNMTSGATYPTPARFAMEMKKSDTSKRKRAVSSGEARNQDVINAAERVMRTMPDSGSPGRANWTSVNLPAQAVGALTGIPAAMVYSDTGRRYISSLLSGRPEGAETVANFIQGFANPQQGKIASLLYNMREDQQ